MTGFAVRSESGDVVVDGVEIGDARWFTADELPEVPPPGTIARRIIDAWIAGELPL
jgi:NAD+ diphosphatase